MILAGDKETPFESATGKRPACASGNAGGDTEAIRWFTLAAEQGHGAGQFSLGLLYSIGVGVPKDLVRSYMWFNLAASGGVEIARRSLDRLAKRMTPPSRSRRPSGWRGSGLRRGRGSSWTGLPFPGLAAGCRGDRTGDVGREDAVNPRRSPGSMRALLDKERSYEDSCGTSARRRFGNSRVCGHRHRNSTGHIRYSGFHGQSAV